MISNPLFSEFLTEPAAAGGQNKNCVGGNGRRRGLFAERILQLFFLVFVWGGLRPPKGESSFFSITFSVHSPSRHRSLLHLFYFCNRSPISSGRWLGVLRLPHFSILYSYFFAKIYWTLNLSWGTIEWPWTFIYFFDILRDCASLSIWICIFILV
jgi:hypothetical protein